MKPYCGILSLPHSCTSPTVVVSAGAMSVKELCWQNCKNTRSQGEESTPCMYQRMQYYFGCLCLNPSSATGRGSTWKEYLYYSTTSTQTPYNPLYRLDIPSRKTHGECRRGERKREREREVGRG